MSRLPDGITRKSLRWALQHRNVIIKSVNAIVTDEARNRHSNGTAKNWGVAIMELGIIGTMANLQTDNNNLLARLDKWKCVAGGRVGPGGPTASYFSNLGHIKDTSDEGPILQFPPEPFYTHPLADAAAKQIENPEKLVFIPPCHNHTHDFYTTFDDVMCPIVGEAKSGLNYRMELDKCLPGICKCLQVMEHSIGITSSFGKCSLHLGSVQREKVFESDICHTLLLESITVEKNEDPVPYVNAILTTLEAMLHIHLEKDGLIYTPDKRFLNEKRYEDDSDCDVFHPKKTRINVPGIYIGGNVVQMKKHYSGMYTWYKKGLINESMDTPYPDTALRSCNRYTIDYIPPMKAKHLRQDGKVLDSDLEDDKNTKEQKIKGKGCFYPFFSLFTGRVRVLYMIY